MYYELKLITIDRKIVKSYSADKKEQIFDQYRSDKAKGLVPNYWRAHLVECRSFNVTDQLEGDAHD